MVLALSTLSAVVGYNFHWTDLRSEAMVSIIIDSTIGGCPNSSTSFIIGGRCLT